MSQTPTVLIIEDDPVFRRVLTFTVAKTGFAVDTANDGEAGFTRLMQRDVAFLVTDYQMPGCGGLELLQRLREVENYQRPPAILCTAKGLELDSETLRKEFDLTAIMHKPFSPRKLSEIIVQTLEAASNTEQSAASPRESVTSPGPFALEYPSLEPSRGLQHG